MLTSEMLICINLLLQFDDILNVAKIHLKLGDDEMIHSINFL